MSIKEKVAPRMRFELMGANTPVGLVKECRTLRYSRPAPWSGLGYLGLGLPPLEMPFKLLVVVDFGD
jgi:hypothetical protein